MRCRIRYRVYFNKNSAHGIKKSVHTYDIAYDIVYYIRYRIYLCWCYIVYDIAYDIVYDIVLNFDCKYMFYLYRLLK